LVQKSPIKSILGASLLILSATACREVAPAFGTTAAAARVNADGLFGGIAQRFTNVERSPKFLVARGKLGHSALTPSVIYNDTSVWTTWAADSTRTLTIDGEFINNRYLFTARPWPATPANEPGDSRHLIRLKRLDDNQFEWMTNVDITAGRIKPDEFANVISRLMASGENRPVADIRADYPGWSIWSGPWPNGETIDDVAVRADRVIARARAADGDALVFAHGHVLRILAARWLALAPASGRMFALSTATLSILGWERETPAIERWNDTTEY